MENEKKSDPESEFGQYIHKVLAERPDLETQKLSPGMLPNTYNWRCKGNTHDGHFEFDLKTGDSVLEVSKFPTGNPMVEMLKRGMTSASDMQRLQLSKIKTRTFTWSMQNKLWNEGLSNFTHDELADEISAWLLA